MEVASIMSYNMPQSYGSRYPSQQYPHYHDMRSFYPEASSYGNGHGQHATESGVASQAASGPLDDPNKPSLPSISTLIGIADGGERGAAPGTERRMCHKILLALSQIRSLTIIQVYQPRSRNHKHRYNHLSSSTLLRIHPEWKREVCRETICHQHHRCDRIRLSRKVTALQ